MKQPDKINFWEQNCTLWNIILPSILSQLVCVGSETITLAFVGQLNDPIKMAGVGASMIFVNVTI